MYRVLFDTNILVDAFAQRMPFAEAANTLILSVVQLEVEGMVSASSITDLYYLLCRQRNHTTGLDAVRIVLEHFTVIPVGRQECVLATKLDWIDYEDAVVLTLSIRSRADYIVTRDKQFIAHGRKLGVQIVQPEVMVDLIATQP